MSDLRYLPCFLSVSLLISGGCQPGGQGEGVESAESGVASDLAWAVNIGGPAYSGIDGTDYVA